LSFVSVTLAVAVFPSSRNNAAHCNPAGAHTIAHDPDQTNQQTNMNNS